MLGNEGRGSLGFFVGPRGEKELAEEGVEGLLDGYAGGARNVELGAEGCEEPAENEEAALFGARFEGWGGEDGGPLRPALADFDDGRRGEEGRGTGDVGEVALDCSEELRVGVSGVKANWRVMLEKRDEP